MRKLSFVTLIILIIFLFTIPLFSQNQQLPPIQIGLVIDVEFQNIAIINGSSGIANLNYISVPAAFERDMQIFKEVVQFKKLAVLINEHFLNSFPELEQRG